MRVLVCGSRSFCNKAAVYSALDRFHHRYTFQTLIHGGQTGADTLAGHWADDNYVWVWKCKANWPKYGRPAGPIRNSMMLKICEPDLVVAFPGGRGTENMVKAARAGHTEVLIVVVDENGKERK